MDQLGRHRGDTDVFVLDTVFKQGRVEVPGRLREVLRKSIILVVAQLAIGLQDALDLAAALVEFA